MQARGKHTHICTSCSNKTGRRPGQIPTERDHDPRAREGPVVPELIRQEVLIS